MRQLKFRAWNENTLRMIYTDWNSFRNWYDLPTGGHVVYGRGFDGEKIILSGPMQYTGKRDKRNVELYEGDIIKDIENWVGIIKWDEKDCFFFVEYPLQNEIMMFDDAFDSDPERNAEIIGNIYNNPELVGASK